MTKFQAQCKHIALREQFYEVKFNIFQRAYAHLRMHFVREDSIVGANRTLENYIKDVGTADNLREAIGQARKKA